MAVRVSQAIRKNRDPVKPCEDALLVEPAHGVFIVVDGITRSPVNGQYPVPSPAADVAERIVQAAFAALAAGHDTPEDALRQAVTAANEAVQSYNQATFPQVNYVEQDLAGAVALIGLLRETVFYYGFIGDCYGLKISDSHHERFVLPQTADLEQHRAEIVSQAGSPREATIIIRRDLRNNPRHPWGYGAFTGELGALDFVRYGRVPLEPGTRLILASDGLEAVCEHLRTTDPLRLTTITPEELIQAAEALDQARNLRSDDKAVILLDALR